jgi:CHAD domain-containing protein
LASVLREQLGAILHELPRALDGHARSVHKARVASRRLREALPVAAFAAGHGDRSGLKRDVRRLTRALGAVREMDVAVRALADEAEAHGWNPAAVEQVRLHVVRERERQEHHMRDDVAREPKRLVDRTRALADEVESQLPANWQSRLATRLRKRTRRFTVAVHAAGTTYAADRLHGVRIAAKKLRYTLELARLAAGTPAGREIAALTRLQDHLGRLHDLQVLQHHVRIVSAEAGCDVQLTRALDAIDQALETECRALHAQFLSRVDRFVALGQSVERMAAAATVDRARRMARPAIASWRRPRRATA